MVEWLAVVVLSPVVRLVNLRDPFSLVALWAGFACAAAWYTSRRPARPLRRIRALLRASTRRGWWAHPSSVLDLELYLATSAIYASGLLGVLLSGETVRLAVDRGLTAVLGPAGSADPAAWWISGVATVALFVLYDLAYWVAHYAMHRIPALWEFHKLHHSAEVLTPLTEWRQHPVELLLFPLSTAVVLGTWSGVQDHLVGGGAAPFSLLGGDALSTVGVFTLLHLRHTELWIPLTGVWGRILQSPAHHQIHHSADPRHHDKNLGLFLSVWDWLFGTLYVPDRRERLTFGLGAEGREHTGLVRVYLDPFRKVLDRRPVGSTDRDPEATR